jgi:hypothetical protein
LKSKNEQRLFIFKASDTFCQFFVHDCQYFLPCALTSPVKKACHGTARIIESKSNPNGLDLAAK